MNDKRRKRETEREDGKATCIFIIPALAASLFEEQCGDNIDICVYICVYIYIERETCSSWAGCDDNKDVCNTYPAFFYFFFSLSLYLT